MKTLTLSMLVFALVFLGSTASATDHDFFDDGALAADPSGVASVGLTTAVLMNRSRLGDEIYDGWLNRGSGYDNYRPRRRLFRGRFRR